MADIVQLVENGVKKFVKTHVQAVEGLESLIAEKTKREFIMFKADGADLNSGISNRATTLSKASSLVKENGGWIDILSDGTYHFTLSAQASGLAGGWRSIYPIFERSGTSIEGVITMPQTASNGVLYSSGFYELRKGDRFIVVSNGSSACKVQSIAGVMEKIG